MDQAEDVEKRRLAYYDAQNLFKREPTPESKHAYTAASAALNLALHHASKDHGPVQDADLISHQEVNGTELPQADQDAVDAAREAANAAFREMYANPNDATHQKWKAAKNYAKKIRRQLDPIFAASLSASTKKSAAKKAGTKN